MKKFLILVIGAGLAGGLAARAQAPVLTSFSPVRNALSAARTSAVVLSFSEPMSAGAASGAAVKVFSCQRGGLLTRAGGGGTFSGAGTNTISFQPAQPFRPGEVVTVVATPAATSAAGAALAVPQVYQFTAKAGVGTAVFVPDSLVRSSGIVTDIALGDVDGDGDGDLVLANHVAGSISIRHNDGTGHFAGGSDITGIGGAVHLELADADGDGDLDVFAAAIGLYPDYTGDKVELYRNDGTGTFTLLERVPVMPGAYRVTLADVDADGDVDILAPAHWLNAPATPQPPVNYVAVRLNDGTGHFDPAGPNLVIAYNVETVAVGDVDADGDLDLLTPSADTARSVGVWLNGGPASFVHTAEVRGLVPRRAVLADMDGDGDLDLLSCSAGGVFSLHRNDGTGAFGPGTRTLLPNTQLDQLIAPDLDGDGDLDVVIANPFGYLILFFNDGLGTLTGPTSLGVGQFNFLVEAADVDGDTDLDLLFERYANQGAGVLLNGGTAVGLAPAVEAEAVSLYPNPATGAVRLVGAPVGPVTVLDAVGRVVRVATIQAGQAEATLSVEGLTPGLYVVRAGQQTRRLVVE